MVAPIQEPYLVTAHELDAALLRELVRVYRATAGVADDTAGREALFARHSREPGWQAGVVGRPLVAFGYGFRCAAGQWWHDVVRAGMVHQYGQQVADDWLTDGYCLAELHVAPTWQRQGIGRSLVKWLLAERSERTAVLSTPDAGDARAFYARLGFVELLPAFTFPGTPEPYTVLGVRLRGDREPGQTPR